MMSPRVQISKAKIDDIKVFTFGVEIEVRNLSELLENLVQVFHNNNKEKRGDGVPLPKASLSFHKTSVSSMNVELVRYRSDT
jgi:hypothetical protein